MHAEHAAEHATAHEATEKAFLEEELALRHKLEHMETTVDTLVGELKDTKGCVNAVLDHFSRQGLDVKPTEGVSGQEFETKIQQRRDTISALKRELLQKDVRIRQLEGQVAAAHEIMAPTPHV